MITGINSQQYSYVNNNHVFLINRYTFPKHLGIEKTYSISQNNLGIVFFSTNKGIITFDGKEWGILNFNNKAFLTSVSNRLFLFSVNYTGEIYKDGSGSYAIKEVKQTYPDKSWNPSDVADLSDTVYIISNQKLWLFHNNSFQKITDSLENGYLFSDSKSIFIKDKQFSKIGKNGLSTVNANFITDKDIRYYNGKAFFPIFSKNHILKFVCTTPGFDNIQLPMNDSVVTTFPDKNNNLWVLFNNSLVCIKYIEYFKYVFDKPLILKSLNGLAKDSSGIYLANNSTIFTPAQTKLQVKKGEIKHLFSLGNNVVFSTRQGIFQYRNCKEITLVERPVSYIFNNADRLFFVSKGSLFGLRFNNNNVSVNELYHLNIDSFQKIIYKKNGDFIILDNENKIYKLTLKENIFALETLYKAEIKNSPQLKNIFLINNEVYANNPFSIYKIEGNKLVNQEKSVINFPSKGHFNEYIEEDSTGGILFSTCNPGEQKHIYYGKNSGNGRINWLEIPIWEADLKDPEILSFKGQEVFLFENGNLIKLTLEKFLNQEDKITVTTSDVVVNNKVIALQTRKKNNKLIPYFESVYPVNLISLKFHASDLTYPEHVKYSFQLKDKDAEWSPWAKLSEKNFSNLPPGDYTLLVKAQTLNGCVSDILTLRFKISPPLYLKWYAWMIYIFLIVGFLGMLAFSRKNKFEKEKIKLEQIIQERTYELTKEKEKTDELLANMLPKDTADELKNTGKATSHKFDMVTVLFSDIQGFTKIAEQMNPEKLIDELDNFFFQFDSVVEKYNIEKIKTIGDAYMAAGGIPYKNRTNPVEVVLAALEMQEYMKNLKGKNTDIWDLRIGVHTGAVIAGVVGHKRISYDIWGDTVNTASRMESSGEASKINISGQTYELVKEFFICEYRGKMPVKYKGDIDMYFVKGLRPELSVNLRSIPNKKFFVQLQLLRIQDLEELVFNKLSAELSPNLTFHNLKHTKDVYTQVELLGRAENINLEEMLIVRTAALFHDTGFIWSYQNHEIKSAEFCREVLPKFKYTEDQISAICNLILCTKKNVVPKNKLEEILVDANTDYWGRVDFIPMLLNLMKELKTNNVNRGEEEWLAMQVNELENHEYYTNTAQKLREIPKKEQIQKIKDQLKQFA